jgi:hypothetical protein
MENFPVFPVAVSSMMYTSISKLTQGNKCFTGCHRSGHACTTFLWSLWRQQQQQQHLQWTTRRLQSSTAHADGATHVRGH